MKSKVIVGMGKALRSLLFGWGRFGGMALVALTLSVRAAIYDVDVSKHILYTDPINPERQIKLGGFSGLIPVPGDCSGTMFYTVTDRGPTQDFLVITPEEGDGTLSTNEYKALPCFGMAPMIVKVQLRPGGKARVLQTIPLKRFGCRGFQPISGRANGVELAPEILSDVFYNPLGFDADGLDPEGITIDHWGFYWICEEYRPSIAMIGPLGNVVLRLVPKGCKTGTETIPTFDVLPGILVKRVNNRGLEGITCAPNGRLYTVVQRPLANPTKAVSEASCNLRLLEINLRSFLACGHEPLVRQLVYRLGVTNKSAYASDLCALSPNVMLVPERKTDALFAIKVSGATDITDFENEDGTLKADPSLTLEQLSEEQLEDLGIRTVKKAVVLPSMIALHKELAKCEGVSVVGKTIVLTYDNDFNLGDYGDGATTPGSILLKSAVPPNPDVYPALITTPMPDEIVFPK
jgi:hypothetical protein